jgi:transposase
MEGRQRRSFTDDYKRQAVDLVASSGRLVELGLKVKK